MDADFPVGMVEEIEKFLSEDKSIPGLDLYPDIFNTNLFFPLQRQAEMASMMREARAIYPKTVMEIGSDKGGSVYAWIKSLPSVKRVIACEIRGTPYARVFEKAFPKIDFLWLPRSSYNESTVDIVQQWLDEDSIDCLFIDGDKGGFLKDFDAYEPLVSPNGIVFLHDIQDKDGPKESFEALKRAGYFTKDIRDISDSLSALDREKKGIPSSGPHEGWLRHWAGKSCGVGVVYLG